MARTPLYKITETEMLSRIAKGKWEIGRRLPNEFELADEFGVSQGTMRRALISLEGMGYLSRKPGRGTLVAAPVAVKDEGKASGPALSPVLLDADGGPLLLTPFRTRATTRAATVEEADAMGTARVAVLERTLKSGPDRAAMDVVAVPESLIAKLDEAAPADLAALLAHHGITPARLSAAAHAEMTDMAQSVALSTDRHAALLVVRMAAHDAAGRVIAAQILRVALPGAQLAHIEAE